MLKIAVVEDQQEVRDELCRFIRQYAAENSLQVEVLPIEDGAVIAEHYEPGYDIIFMDVEMPGLDGFGAAEKIRAVDADAVLVFVTNMAQYAIKGYEVDALDYVLKPVSYFAFSQRLERAISRLKRRERKYIALPVKGGVRKLDTSEIYYVESQDHDLTFHTRSGSFRSGLTMRQAEEHLSGAHFFRGNNSYLINLEHVDGVQDGCAIVQGEQLKLSRPRKNAFLEALSNYMGEVMK